MNVPFVGREIRWLKNREAADRLGVDSRTIKRWMKLPDYRTALTAIQNGKHWRIPRPENLATWTSEALKALNLLGVVLKETWERDLEHCGKDYSRFSLESYRLWLAAYMKQLDSDRITQEASYAIDRLRLAAHKVLEPLPRHEMEADKLEEQFHAVLLDEGLSTEDADAVMRYWPDKAHFEQVRSAHTLDDLEKIRRDVDFKQAVRELESSGRKSSGENIRPLLHKDFAAHINDTREDLPGMLVKAQSREQLRRMTDSSVCDQTLGKKKPLVTIDFRQPQVGRKLRTYRKLYPMKAKSQLKVVADVNRTLVDAPGIEARPATGKTPIRKPDYDGSSMDHLQTVTGDDESEI